MSSKKKGPKVRKELSVFDEELNLRFNPTEFLPDLPSHAKGTQSSDVPIAESHGVNRVQMGSTEPESHGVNRVQMGSNGFTTRVQTGSGDGFKPLPLGELFVLRVIADLEEIPGDPVFISRQQISQATGQTTEGVKTAIRRLSKRPLIQLSHFHRGWSNGGAAYKILPAGREVLTSKTALLSLGFKRVHDSGSNGFTSSSGIKDLNRTTTTSETTDREKNSHPTNQDPAWEKIDFECLKDIGFKQAHVAQVKSWGNHTAQSLQDSLYAFKFDLNENKRGEGVREPLNFFMGILRKGPYTPPANYESPEDRQLRGYLEAKETILEKRRKTLERLKAAEFEEWADSLSATEIEKLAPMGTTSSPLKRSQLLNHFDENIWEGKKKEILERLRTKLEGTDPFLIPKKKEYTTESIPPLNPPATRASYDF